MWRKYSALKLLISAKAIAKWSQSHYRGNVGRAEYSKVNRERRALQIQTCGRRYIAMNMFKRVLSSALVIQCARRCHLSRLAFNLKKAHARDMNVVVQERDKLRSDMIALKAELQKAKEDSKPQPPSEDIIDKLKKKDEEIETLRSELDRITIEKETLTNSLQEAKEAIQHVKSDKERVLKELEELKSFNQALEDENRHMTESFSNLDEIMLLNAPPAPVTAEVERALDEAVRKITELEQANKKLKAANESLQNSQMISTESCMIDNEIAKKAAPMQTYVDAPALPLTSVYTTATTDNMTDTEDEIARLREENHVLQNQLQLLRNNNQGILPEIMGSDQEYEESVNPSDNEDEDESSGFDRYVKI
jgi:myosin heavy subunit